MAYLHGREAPRTCMRGLFSLGAVHVTIFLDRGPEAVGAQSPARMSALYRVHLIIFLNREPEAVGAQPPARMFPVWIM